MILADTILVNAKVATVDSRFSFCEAVAVRGGWILDTGTTKDMLAYRGAGTQVIDLGGLLMLPAAHDSHIHALCFAQNSVCLDCGVPAVSSLAALRSAIARAAAKLPDGAWIRGVNLTADQFPDCPGGQITRADIDDACCGHPAILQDWTAHGALANTLALHISGIGPRTEDPQGGSLARDAHGQPTGYLQEASATYLVYRHVPLWTEEELTAAILRMQKFMNSQGYAGYTECTLGPANNAREYGVAGERGIFLYRKLAEEQRLTTRVSVGFYSGVNGVQSYDDMKRDFDSFPFPEIRDPLWFDLHMAKIFCDGVHLFHSGWMRQDYADMPGSHGHSCLSAAGDDAAQAEELRRMIELAHCRGFQVGIHTIGDRAVEESINAIAAVKQQHPGQDLRHYVIHAETLGSAAQAEKAARFGIPYSVQPGFMDHSFEGSVACVGQAGERIFDLRTPLEKGVVLCGGSDAVAGAFTDWRRSARSALLRRSSISGRVYHPELRVGIEDAVRMYTINGAYQEHMEQFRGSIEPGKTADFQILDRDIFRIPPEELGDAAVLMTMVNGKIVFEK